MMKNSHTLSRLFSSKNERYYCFIMNTEKEKHITNFIRSICLNKSEEELNQAESNFIRYIELVEKIANRLAYEKEKRLD